MNNTTKPETQHITTEGEPFEETLVTATVVTVVVIVVLTIVIVICVICKTLLRQKNTQEAGRSDSFSTRAKNLYHRYYKVSKADAEKGFLKKPEKAPLTKEGSINTEKVAKKKAEEGVAKRHDDERQREEEAAQPLYIEMSLH